MKYEYKSIIGKVPVPTTKTTKDINHVKMLNKICNQVFLCYNT